MKHRKFGRIPLPVSEVSLNTARFGWFTDQTESFALLDAYYTCGGTFLHTLGDPAGAGSASRVPSASEDIVADWRTSRGVARDTVVIAARLNLAGVDEGGSGLATAQLIREACERSLRRLRSPHVDFLVCDRNDLTAPTDEILEAIDGLVRAGWVRYAVADGFPPWQAVDSLYRSRMGHGVGFDGMKTEFSLLNANGPEAYALTLAGEHRLGFIAASPLADGFLARSTAAVRKRTHLDRDWTGGRASGSVLDRVLSVLAEIADKRLATPSQIALAWVLHHPQVSSAVISPANPAELRELARATSFQLTAEEADMLATAAAAHAAPEPAGAHPTAGELEVV